MQGCPIVHSLMTHHDDLSVLQPGVMMTESQDTPEYRTPIQLLDELRPHHQQSYRWALTCCGGSREEAEDLLQDIYLEILAGSLTYRRESTPRVWLFGVIRVSSISRRRKIKRRLKLLALHIQTRVHTLASLSASSPALEHQEQIQRREVLCAIAKLSPQQRSVIELVFYHDLTIAEAAQVCEISLGSARTHYQRGKRHLERQLEHLNVEPELDTSSQPLTYGVSD